MVTSPSKILVVDDDTAIRNLVYRFLSLQDYELESAASGADALSAFEQFKPDLVILDLNLPDISGFDLCKKLRSQTDVSILMLTCLNNTQHILKGFEQGADDYLTKPFDLHILLARIKAVLRRKLVAAKLRTPSNSFLFDRVFIDPQACEVRVDGYPVTLTALEYNLLYFLATHPHRVWKRHELVEEVWQEDYIKQDRKVDVHIGQLRRKIDDCENQLIQTVRGQGYRFVPPQSQIQKSA
ncbi:MAG: response regulator transcription factor [Jaaginema sp. PMC 1079.18]|nr:response regulator transcription factor [Jaaginema sp. PMC 1080.18]MEC4854135.1 response regulator transcription factor [Jaaginema sp. PMC 1079.18]MEC4864513.1 response regulator transcription factor [Jaaginema sp. PMC 1078.18]